MYIYMDLYMYMYIMLLFWERLGTAREGAVTFRRRRLENPYTTHGK